MNPQGLFTVRGVVSNLRVRQSEEDFVSNTADKTAGAAVAVGLVAEGLAGAATSAAFSSADMAERVDFFACQVAEHVVRGRFGKVSFSDGDFIEVVCQPAAHALDAFAVRRPSDRTIWMHPHCGRGSTACRRFAIKSILLLSFGFPLILCGLLDLFVSDQPMGVAVWLAMSAVGAVLVATVLLFVASRFLGFARLSNDIFAALDFDKPPEVDLPRHLSDASKMFSNTERFNYHPYARWVYKY